MADPSTPNRPGRKLLVAAVGVATVSYVVACGTSSSDVTPADTGADAALDGRTDISSGNLVAPDTGSDTGADADTGGFDVSSGNLVPPDTGPPDAGPGDGKDAD